MDWSQIWPIIATLVGGGGFLTVALQEWTKYRSGRADEERQENLTLAQKAQQSEAWREYEATYRRLIMEHCSHVRRVAIEYGAPIERIGTWPSEPTKPEPPKIAK
ncbi:hypothetical protein ACNPM8_01780 [Glutamicibacter sp. AGC46]